MTSDQKSEQTKPYGRTQDLNLCFALTKFEGKQSTPLVRPPGAVRSLPPALIPVQGARRERASVRCGGGEGEEEDET